MSKKHASKPPRRKSYRPRAANPGAAHDVILKSWRTAFMAAPIDNAKMAELRARFSQELDADQQKDWAINCKTALVLLKNGNGGLDDWGAVARALNTAMVLCERGFGLEFLSTVVEAQDQIFAVKVCFDKTGAWGWSDEANNAVNEGLDVFAAQLEVTTEADIFSAFAEMHRLIEVKQVYMETPAA